MVRFSVFQCDRLALKGSGSGIHLRMTLTSTIRFLYEITDFSLTTKEHAGIALDFLTAQQNRLIPIEEALLHRTDELLPRRDEQMTCTELARLLRDLQTKNVQIMEQLDLALGGIHHEKWNDCNLPLPSPVMPPPRPSLATSFPTITETDNETDGTPASRFSSTHCSSIQASSERYTKKTTSPLTPTLASLNLSLSTTTALHFNDGKLETPRSSLDAIEVWRAQRVSDCGTSMDRTPAAWNGASTENQEHLLPLEHRNSQGHIHLNRNTFVPTKDHHYFDQYEIPSTSESAYGSQSEAVDHTHYDYYYNNNNDDDDDSIQEGQDGNSVDMDTSNVDRNALDAALKRLSIAPSESSMLQDETLESREGDGQTYGDETTLATQPTIVRPDRLRLASLRGSLEGGDRSVVSFVDENSMIHKSAERKKPATKSRKMAPDSPGVHSVREVVVNMTLASVSPNNLTMEHCSFHESETIASPSHSRIMDQADLLSVTSLLVTPILDRYRLEADDSSIGIKVVPNERGRHRRNEVLVGQLGLSRKPFSESSNTPGKDHKTKSFRKTPHPKKIRKPNLQSIVESVSPRMSNDTEAIANTQRPKSSSCRIIIPELPVATPTIRSHKERPDSNTRRRLSAEYESTKVPPSTNPSTPQSTPSIHASVSRTPLTAAWIARHMSSDANIMESMGMEEVSFTAKEIDFSSKDDNSVKSSSIKFISMGEFKTAPRVVQMQVNISEVNTAAEILSQWIIPNERVKESDAYLFLPFPEKKSKSILMSLCHWRRMKIHVEPNGERTFSLLRT